MKHVLIAFAATLLSANQTALPRDYAIRAVPMTAVTINDGFWAPKLEVNRLVTIPHILKQNDDTGRSHELYNAGHLYEAAVAHFEATGKRTLLDIAIKNADLACRTFGANGRHAVSGHEEIELALVKLYRATGNHAYLGTAEWLVAERGKPHPDMPPYPDKAFEMYNDRAYKQDQAPVVEQDRAIGHAVRAMYLYAAVADVAALSSNDAFARAADHLCRTSSPSACI